MTITQGAWWQAHRAGTGAVAENAHLISEHKVEKANQEWRGSFEVSKPTPSDTPPLTKPRLLLFLDSSTNWGPIKYMGLWGTILVQTTTMSICACVLVT